MDCIFVFLQTEKSLVKVYEDESVIAFHDLDPQAPTHVLIIPKMHISSAMEINEENSGIIGHIYEVAAKYQANLGLKMDSAL